MKTQGISKLTAIIALALLSQLLLGNASAHSTYNMDRLEFNRRAADEFLPLFWRADTNNDGIIQPDELVVLIGFGQPHENELSHWIDSQHHFTQHFAAAFHQIASAPRGTTDADAPRQKVIRQELAQGRTTLVETDLSHASPGEASMVRHLINAAKHIENIYQQQKGVFGLEVSIPATDLASQMLFYRNQSPFCEAPATQHNELCNALITHPTKLSGLYPAAIQSDTHFCDALAKSNNAADLMDHFSVVMNGDKAGTYKSVPYSIAYKKDMQAIAMELEAAATALDDSEAAYKDYLRAAAQSFRSNDWEPANRAWVAMSATNSKWYARIAPDEVYYEPCAWKAGFALQLARINTASLAWQQKLEPLKNEMEQTLASMAGAPYKARDVHFKIPDFIDVVLNAGDQRNATRATIGQSLPNWGPVAESGGRTVAMTNLFTDVDSNNSAKDSMSSVFCADTNTVATTSPENSLITSLLHEMAHNLGPSHEYRVDGKTDVQAFGGPLSSTLEELKAQTSAMFLTDWLSTKSLFTAQRARELHTYDVSWMLGHISSGMYTADGKALNYSHLAAIQLGWLIKQNAITWHADDMAANGKDKGCMELHYDKLPAAIQSLETTVLQIKGKADKQTAEQLKAEYVDGKNDFAKLKDTITERWLRTPKGSLVYSLHY
jgi:hypothetical protein